MKLYEVNKSILENINWDQKFDHIHPICETICEDSNREDWDLYEKVMKQNEGYCFYIDTYVTPSEVVLLYIDKFHTEKICVVEEIPSILIKEFSKTVKENRNGYHPISPAIKMYLKNHIYFILNPTSQYLLEGLGKKKEAK